MIDRDSRVAIGFCLHIAVAGFRARGDDAKGNQLALGRSVTTTTDRRLERLRVRNNVICRHDQQHRIGVLFCRKERRKGYCRCRIASLRFQHYLRGLADRTQLFGDEETVSFIADNHTIVGRIFHALQTLRGLLQHRRHAVHKWKQLLRVQGTRRRPKPGSRAAGKNDGDDLVIFASSRTPRAPRRSGNHVSLPPTVG